MQELLAQFDGRSAIDILILAVILYNLFIFIRGTRAAQMVTGIVFLVGGIYVVSQLYSLTTINWMMNKFYASFIIILVVIFQDDIRDVLSRMGKKSFLQQSESFSSRQMLDEITRAAASLATKRIGALIVLERNIILTRYIDVGILVDSKVSKEILESIFHPSSPIHDGAVVLQQGRIAAAGCFLPLTRDDEVDPVLGTRHRAAIGVSQESDAIVVLVSEERGSVSLVVDGKISRDLDVKEMRKALRNLMNQRPEDEIQVQRTSSTNWNILERFRMLGSKKK